MTYRRRLVIYCACASVLWLCVQFWIWSQLAVLPTQFVPQRQDVTLIGMFDWAIVVTEAQSGSGNSGSGGSGGKVYTTEVSFSTTGIVYSAAASILLVVGAVLWVRFLVTTQAMPSEYCDRCGYHRRGIETTRCPECGSEQPARGSKSMNPLRQGIAWRAVVAVTLFTAGYTIQLAASRITLLDVHESLSGTTVIPNATQWSELLALSAEVMLWLSVVWILTAIFTLYPYRNSLTISR